MNKNEYQKLCRNIEYSCNLQNLHYKSFRLDNGLDFQLLSNNPKQIKKNLLIIAGIHWNEQAPVYAINEFISEYNFDKLKNTRIFIVPCFNPYWLISNQRKNDYQSDLNRIRTSKKLEEEQVLMFQQLFNTNFDWVLSLHEDYSTKKTYLYCYNKNKDNLYRKVQKEIWKVTEVNLNNKIDWIVADKWIIYNYEDKSLDNFFYKSWVEYVICSETWMRESLESRIKTNKVIIKNFIEWINFI